MTPTGSTLAQDRVFMARAVALADQAAGRSSPGPAVGVVVVRSGVVLSEGSSRGPGSANAAEAVVRNLGGNASGAALFINIEPSGDGDASGSCAQLLATAGLSRMVVGVRDPGQKAAAGSVDLLRAAGVAVDVGVLASACRRVNGPYLRVHEKGRPLVVLKAAITLDGRIADSAGTSQWITGSDARQAGHRLRDRHDAVMVGSGTLLADDPSLNTRTSGGRDAVPVVLDSNLRIAADARLWTAGRPPLVFCGPDAPVRSLPGPTIRVPRGPAGLDINAVLSELVARGIQSVLVEGGARVHRSLWDAGVVDRVHLFVAPLVLAGGPGWMAGPGIPLGATTRLSIVEVTSLEGDLHVVLDS